MIPSLPNQFIPLPNTIFKNQSLKVRPLDNALRDNAVCQGSSLDLTARDRRAGYYTPLHRALVLNDRLSDCGSVHRALTLYNAVCNIAALDRGRVVELRFLTRAPAHVFRL
ncbi:uncharacterized protein N7518_003760 [Penicillium psychrosexuale]|uniref:uncharacterized protein n=1 Tax=Penicillium psychrosexuale TaxID=1002107 RepID=UPI00254502E8|nr:uncharacterized protein N7518_003760 [Penicillium psychrosexuale]KAJ5801692.1 hypothetical protein N7518_003760 [Penicillium psychrosexuale]